LFPRTEPVFYPYIVLLKASPAVAFAPMLSILFKSGPEGKVVVAAMIAFFPLVIGGTDGLRRTPESLELMAAGYGAKRWGRLAHINGGFILSGFLSGLKTAAPLSVVGAIVGEFVQASEAGKTGVGIYIASHARNYFMSHVLAGVVLSTLLGLAFFALALVVSRFVEGVLFLEKQS
jgi:NitT/TauT family transport system permease protein